MSLTHEQAERIKALALKFAECAAQAAYAQESPFDSARERTKRENKTARDALHSYIDSIKG